MKKAQSNVIKPLAKVIPIPMGSTPRRCRLCPNQATHYQFSIDERGGVNDSSKKPVCTEHRKTA